MTPLAKFFVLFVSPLCPSCSKNSGAQRTRSPEASGHEGHEVDALQRLKQNIDKNNFCLLAGFHYRTLWTVGETLNDVINLHVTWILKSYAIEPLTRTRCTTSGIIIATSIHQQ